MLAKSELHPTISQAIITHMVNKALQEPVEDTIGMDALLHLGINMAATTTSPTSIPCSLLQGQSQIYSQAWLRSCIDRGVYSPQGSGWAG